MEGTPNQEGRPLEPGAPVPVHPPGSGYPAAPPPSPYVPLPPQRHPALIGVELAGWWSRAGATLIDGLIVLVEMLAIGAAFGFGFYLALQWSTPLAVIVAVVGFLVLTAIALLYAPMAMKRSGRRNGQTYGKQALGITVVRLNGQPFDLGAASVREIAVKMLMVGVAGSVSGGVAQFLDYLWPLWDDNRQALHDKVASTAVVRAP